MGSIFEFNRHCVLSLQQANQLLPLVYKITAESDEQLKKVMSQIKLSKANSEQAHLTDLEVQAQQVISKWESKMIKLGLEPKGVWLVDFDSGNGYFCWKYPELELKFWHGYNDGFSGRTPLENQKDINECDPLH